MSKVCFSLPLMKVKALSITQVIFADSVVLGTVQAGKFIFF